MTQKHIDENSDRLSKRCNYCGHDVNWQGSLKISKFFEADKVANKVSIMCYICAMRFFNDIEYYGERDYNEIYTVTPSKGIDLEVGRLIHERDDEQNMEQVEDCIVKNIIFKKIDFDMGKQYIEKDDGTLEYSSQTELRIVKWRMICCSCRNDIEKDCNLDFVYYKLHGSWGYMSDFDMDRWYSWICVDCGDRMINQAFGDVKPYRFISGMDQCMGKRFFEHYGLQSKKYDQVWEKVLEEFKLGKSTIHYYTDYDDQKYINRFCQFEESKLLNTENENHIRYWTLLSKGNIEIEKVIEFLRTI